ncbi:hypothetical protein EUBDOL_00109 [Amedibacillus dolichus DSM 3991]|uniref:Uncharacterized protein n=1 Tax=Amedibacillus dolichus DSM 3991 TaxID=428127 RepID=A8R7X7_9FIRM|nr:hypothetical protein EUBDOL_00109 [Amedibacillus dolichus DSM 3991]
MELYKPDKWLTDIPNIWDNEFQIMIVFYVQIMPDDFVMQLHRF